MTKNFNATVGFVVAFEAPSTAGRCRWTFIDHCRFCVPPSRHVFVVVPCGCRKAEAIIMRTTQLEYEKHPQSHKQQRHGFEGATQVVADFVVAVAVEAPSTAGGYCS